MPLVDLIRTHALAAERIHADNTTVPSPGQGQGAHCIPQVTQRKQEW
jgi:hypothetical protein